MSIFLSKSAADRISSFLTKRGNGFGLRLGVRTSGCSGMAYVLELIDKPSVNDLIFEEKGIKIVVDKNSFKFINGIKLDFVKEGFNESFKFKNPNEKERCGCGESFNV